jgi:hypothetical protein
MNDEELKQRIQYLVEHGGLYEDPIAEVRRWARWGVGLACCGLTIDAVFVILALR